MTAVYIVAELVRVSMFCPTKQRRINIEFKTSLVTGGIHQQLTVTVTLGIP